MSKQIDNILIEAEMLKENIWGYLDSVESTPKLEREIKDRMNGLLDAIDELVEVEE